MRPPLAVASRYIFSASSERCRQPSVRTVARTHWIVNSLESFVSSNRVRSHNHVITHACVLHRHVPDSVGSHHRDTSSSGGGGALGVAARYAQQHAGWLWRPPRADWTLGNGGKRCVFCRLQACSSIAAFSIALRSRSKRRHRSRGRWGGKVTTILVTWLVCDDESVGLPK